MENRNLPKTAREYYNEGARLGKTEEAHKNFRLALHSYLDNHRAESNHLKNKKSQATRTDKIKHLESMLDIAETNCQLISFLPITSDEKIQIANRKAIKDLSESFLPLLAFSRLINPLPEKLSKRITHLSTHILHKKYAYLYDQSKELLKTPFLKDQKDFSKYCKNNTRAIAHAKKIITLLGLPTPSSLTINSYDNKNSATDQYERKQTIKELKKDWDNYITRLADYEKELSGLSSKDEALRLDILKTIIEEAEDFLDYFESEIEIKLEPKYHFTLFSSLEDFYKLCTDPAEKKQYFELLKEKYFTYKASRGSFRTIEKLELLSYELFIYQEEAFALQTPKSMKNLQETAREILRLPFVPSAEELMKSPWINNVYDAANTIKEIEKAEKLFGRLNIDEKSTRVQSSKPTKRKPATTLPPPTTTSQGQDQILRAFKSLKIAEKSTTSSGKDEATVLEQASPTSTRSASEASSSPYTHFAQKEQVDEQATSQRPQNLGPILKPSPFSSR